MKSIILRYGLIGGVIAASVLIGGTAYCYNTGVFGGNMVLGYAAMILAFSLIFVALKQLRDKRYGGVISFGKAFKAALLIALVTSTVYVLVWLFCYYLFIPDFMEKYTAQMLMQAKQKGLSGAELTAQTAQMDQYREMYKNPLFVILLTYMEILPVGLIVSLVAALIIKRKQHTLQQSKDYVAGAA